MQLHPLSLSFQGKMKHLEEGFAKSVYENEKYMLEIRVVVFMTLLFYSAFALLDVLLVPESYKPLFVIRFGIFCPYALLMILFSYSRFFGNLMQPVFVSLALIGGGGIIVMIVITPPPVTYSYYAGLILIFMFIYSFGRVRFVWATLSGWLLILFYEISAIYAVDTPLPVLINNNFFFISANVIGMVSCYLFEYFDRRNYFITIQLEAERRKTKDANEELEQRVLERTSLLNNINEDLKLEIEERKRIEEELRTISNELEIRVENRTYELINTNKALEHARDVANESTRAKSEFLANMSHEIRTPMNAIIGMSDLAMDLGTESKQRNEYLGIIRASARSLLGIINDILDLSKIEAGRLELEATPFRVREYIEGVADMFIEKIHSKGIGFVLDVAPDIPYRVIGDPLRLQQVLLNLISNAIKFTDKGEICLEVKIGEVTSDTIELLFEVRDTGIGIDLENTKDLFNAFEQADGSTTRKYGGTGLGLAICKRIVMMMNGTISIESEPDKGSCFKFNVIMQTDHETGVTRGSGSTISEDALKILVVINNAALNIATTKMITSFGFRCDVSDTVETAVSTINRSTENNIYDMVLLDEEICRPDIETAVYGLLKAFKGSPPPLLLIGSLKTEAELNSLKQCGVDSYLVKPLKPTNLYTELMGGVDKGQAYTLSVFNTEKTYNYFNGMDVLLVEDNPVNQIVATEILHLGGINVSKAVNGIEALEMIKAYSFDAVLMDVQMPGMDGLEATRIIRHEIGNMDLPVIAMSAHVMKEDREKCMAAGMDDFIPKPVDRDQLFNVLARYYSSNGISFLGFSDSCSNNETEPDIPDVLPGLDVKDGLKRLNCSIETYVQLVRQFCEYYNDIIDKIKTLFDEGKFDAIKQEAHSLKGASGNISAQNLSASAKNLEDSITSNSLSAIEVSILEMEHSHRELIRSCEALISHVQSE